MILIQAAPKVVGATPDHESLMCAKHRLSSCLLFALVLSGAEEFRATALAQSAIATNVVVVLSFEGRLDISRAGSPRWDAAQTNQVLDPGDRIRTGPNSRATLQLYDLSVVRVDQRSLFQIEPPPDQDASVLVRLFHGVLYLFHRDKPGSVRFQSESSTAATRGTELNVAVDEADGRMTLTLFEGEAELIGDGGSVILVSGEQGIAGPGRTPSKSTLVRGVDVIQWCLYYPAVFHPPDAALGEEPRRVLRDSLEAYRAGDLQAALALYPDSRQPGSDAERVYLAALILTAGRASEAETILAGIDPSRDAMGRLAGALRLMIATVRGEARDWAGVPTAPEGFVTEWLARSYAHQSRGELKDALRCARRAAEMAPDFGLAWARLAELEFSFARIQEARAALDEARRFSPHHAPAAALAGFLFAAENRIERAWGAFDEAIVLDGALADAWLGRGLCKIRTGQSEAGRSDLQTAVALEPTRAVLRSYLGKAYRQEGDRTRAFHELDLARTLDPADPTAWLYQALLNQENNRVNEAVRDLERSMELNDNRRIYRSRMLLDQDRAVRGANLANVHKDAGMTAVAVREATRAVNTDYANHSAHRFLANSYDELRDPNQVDLRYETAWFSEYLLANLLAPVGAGPISQLVSSQEYARLFERDRLGLVSTTEYLSRGDWRQAASQFGRFQNTSYALEVDYRDRNGQRFNNDQEQLSLWLEVKQQLGLKDSLFAQAVYYDAEGGDLASYYDPADANPEFRFEEHQEPLALAGYHHEWSPEHHTLLVGARLHDQIEFFNPTQPELLLFQTNGQTALVPSPAFSSSTNRYEKATEIWSAEAQHIWQGARHNLVAGGRFQFGTFETDVRRLSNAASIHLFLSQGGGLSSFPPPPSATQDAETEFYRSSIYSYGQWQVWEPLQLTAGISYDRMQYPRNALNSPVSDDEETVDQWSPKAGWTWQPDRRTTLRGAYARSLGGVSLEQSVRLEPVQVAGFNQAFRNLIPESVAGEVPAMDMDLFGLALERRFATGTYVTVEASQAFAHADRQVGNNDLTVPPPPAVFGFSPGDTRQELDYEEKSLLITGNQLVSDEWALGARYRLSRADLERRWRDIPSAAVTLDNLAVSTDEQAILHQVSIFALFHHPTGFFGRAESQWTQQSNRGYDPDIPGDDFWQSHVWIGYRLPGRRAEWTVGLLNLFDQDYRLNPLNLTPELPRERTFTTTVRFFF